MAQAQTVEPDAAAARPRELLKWTVYALLLLNWAWYAWEEWQFSQHTLRDGATLIEWAGAFATTLDEGAWFGLLFLWELETWWLPWDWNRPWLRRLILAARLVCYTFIAHTVAARALDFRDVIDPAPMAGVASLCDLSVQDYSFTHNLEYTRIDGTNCGRLSAGGPFYAVESAAVTDAAGLEHERVRRWVDVADAVTWLLVMFTIELGIWLQERRIAGGPLMLASFAGKVFYGMLFVHAGYWAWHGHWLYAWDQVLWIGGFFAIELNLSDWRRELRRRLRISSPALDAVG